jgi:hypothetical protein
VARAHTPHPGPVDLPPYPNVPADTFPALCLGSTGGDQDHRVPRAPLPGLGVTQHRGVLIDLLSAPLTILLVCCHIKSFQRASRCGEAMARRRKEERRAGLASRGM